MVNAHLPEDVILLPLYPRFSTTSTGSSFGAWHAGSGRGARGAGAGDLCYPDEPGFIAGHGSRQSTPTAELPNRPICSLLAPDDGSIKPSLNGASSSLRVDDQRPTQHRRRSASLTPSSLASSALGQIASVLSPLSPPITIARR